MEREQETSSRRIRTTRTLADMPTVRVASPIAADEAVNTSDARAAADVDMAPVLPSEPETPPQRHSRSSQALSHALSRPLPGALVPYENEHTLLVPAGASRHILPASPGTAPGRRGKRWGWAHLTSFVAVAVTLTVALGVALDIGGVRPGTTQLSVSQSVPLPTGRGPWTASSGAIRIVPAPPPPTPKPQTANNAAPPGIKGQASPLEPCHDSYQFVPNISEWTVPPGCYSLIYVPNPANYVQRPGFGYCNWWVRVTHPDHYDITENTSYPRGSTPIAGAAVFFDSYEQGALSEGHWAQVVAVSSDHYWVLISEMNFAWRGGGFGRIDYRYIHVSPHVHFVYVFS